MFQPPTPEQLLVVRRETNQTYPGKVEEISNQLQEWMETQPHLPRNYDKRILGRMIVGTKCDLNRVKRKLENYFCFRSKMPEFFSQRDPFSPEIQAAWRAISILPLAKTRPDGARVTVHIINDVDSADHTPKNIYKLFLMMGDIRLVEDTEISGDVYVFDLANLNISIMLMHAGSLLKKVLNVAQEAYPQRLKEIHIVNAHSFVAKGINLFRSFMKEKMRNRFVVHENLSSLHRYVPREILPAEYGGVTKTVQQLKDQWSKTLESYASYFVQQEGVKGDDCRKAKKSKKASNCNQSFTQHLETTQGSFRNLCLD